MAICAIDGRFFTRPLTGIERFAMEITKRLDTLSESGTLEIILPSKKSMADVSFKNIRQIHLPHTFGRINRIKWFLFWLFHKNRSLDFSNNLPRKGGIAFLHDIYCKTHTEDFRTLREKIGMYRAQLQYKKITRYAKIICTVSEFSKQQIMQHYGVPAEKIKVIYNGVEHMKQIDSDVSIFNRFPEIKQKQFYFTLGSLSLRKNLKWIALHAELYPNEQFVVSGGALKNLVPDELQKLGTLPNVILTGRVSDAEIKALMQSCKAFVFPSYFEGFGIPPLEALYCGAPIIIARASCLPEIYADAAHYIDPFNPNVDLDKLLAEPVSSPDKLFKKYSLDKSAAQLYELLKN